MKTDQASTNKKTSRGLILGCLGLIFLLSACATPQPTEPPAATAQTLQSASPTHTAPSAASQLPTSTPSPTPTLSAQEIYARLPYPPSYVEADGETRVFFSPEYRELPEAQYPEGIIVPDMIIMHTDGQFVGSVAKWNTGTTFHGLGAYYSVHFAVCREEVVQMLPMYAERITQASGALPQIDAHGNKIPYNNHSVQLEMCGNKYNYLITGEADEAMIAAIKSTTETATDMVISLMVFYGISIDNVVGHYQIGAGKPDPGDLYFEQYFLPMLTEKWAALQNRLGY